MKNRNNNKVVIGIGGPAHSGKSIFINKMLELLPTEKTYLIRGCPDGEGARWSGGNNQYIVQLLRKKGQYDREFIDDVKRKLKIVQSQIILLDLGGIPSEENAELLSNCDYFIILSREKSKILEWELFIDSLKPGRYVPLQKLAKVDGQNILIQYEKLFDEIIADNEYFIDLPKMPKVIASFESILGENLEDNVYEENGILKGKVVNLERGMQIDSLTIKTLAEKLIKEMLHDNNKTHVQDTNVNLELDEEFIVPRTKENNIDINLFKEYIKIYMRLYLYKNPNFNMYRKENFSAREVARRKCARVIQSRVDRMKQDFLLKVSDKNVVKKDIIDVNKIADFLGLKDENEVIIWKEEKLAETLFLISSVMKDMKNVKIYGARPNWLACGIEEIAKLNGIEDISFYDLTKSGVPLPRIEKYQRESRVFNKTTESYINSRELKKGDGENPILEFDVLESEDSILLYISPKKAILSEDDLSLIVLPEIAENKKLYISGRLPLWVTTSITRTYGHTEKSIHQPNKGFIKFASMDFKQLGIIEKNPPNINFVKFLEEKNGGR